MLTTITVILVILKLAAVIDWSWKLVLLPTIIEIAVGLVWLFVALLVAVIGAALSTQKYRFR